MRRRQRDAGNAHACASPGTSAGARASACPGTGTRTDTCAHSGAAARADYRVPDWPRVER